MHLSLFVAVRLTQRKKNQIRVTKYHNVRHLFIPSLYQKSPLCVSTENLPKRGSVWRRGRSSWNFGGSSRSRESSPGTWSGSAKQVRLISQNSVGPALCVCVCVLLVFQNPKKLTESVPCPFSLLLQRRCCWRRRMRLQRRSPRWMVRGTRGSKTFQVKKTKQNRTEYLLPALLWPILRVGWW